LSRVVPLIAFGVALVVGGFYWAVWEGSRGYLEDFVIADEYYNLGLLIWRIIPIVIIGIGIMCLIAAGMGGRRETVVVE
jgi:hypothetical protein